MRRRTVTMSGLWLAGTASAWARKKPAADIAGPSYRLRADAQEAAQAIAQEHGLDADWVAAALAEARYVGAVAQLMMPPTSPTAKNWAAYRARFIERRRIDAGRAWWDDNADALAEAELRWGVPAQTVVGIVGVETFYGRMTGGFRVLDALATLSFDFPKGRSDRSAFFRSELGHYVALARREGWEPAAVKGSYAGAMGLPQFMPSSLRHYGVDMDGDGRVDLFASGADVAGSVANYLAEHGWRRGMPTHYAADAPAATVERATLLVSDIVPSFSPQQMREHGARLGDDALAHEGSLALIELLNGEAAPSYAAGTQNFYAITRYNASSYYAMAVIELGQAVAAARG
ncbi:MAG: lytic murein transglycosylase B [Burkholderiaceae bacterium]